MVRDLFCCSQRLLVFGSFWKHHLSILDLWCAKKTLLAFDLQVLLKQSVSSDQWV